MAKAPAYRSKALRDSARARYCTLQIPGICNGNPETTVLCHLPCSTHGMGYKSDDYWAVFGCSSCHDVIDGRTHFVWQQGEKEEILYYALHRTLSFWFFDEIIKG
ncbi:DUF1364 domain-containing protein [Serratia ficaria]|uniref:DUF1364 domain-containing protein n=1 Tax=Serratia ficaria TaxID=61651 RepID=UPI0012B6BFBA|nr:DUF1364 domain-containing protein [Serratia ficaria]